MAWRLPKANTVNATLRRKDAPLKLSLIVLSTALLSPLAGLHAEDAFLTLDGQPRAEILISENPQRSARLAAHDLQTYVKKLSGAHLPIVTRPSERLASVFVGRSEYTDRLKITAEGLKHGANRIRETGSEASAFAPTGKANFHEVMKFAHFYEGRSHQFTAGEPDDDYLEATRIANEFVRQGKRAEALAAYITAADGKITDLQKSAALEQAAAMARALRQYDVADQLTARIPLDAVQKCARMRGLLDQAQAPQVVAQFGKEDIRAWPFWKAGDGYFHRGLAHAITKAGKEAELDLTRALEWSSDPRLRDSIRQVLAVNREENLKDDDAALAAYRQTVDSATQLRSGEHYTAVAGVARILTTQGKFDDALAMLGKVDIDKLGGSWRGSLLVAQGNTLKAAGRRDEALVAYQAALDDPSTDAHHRKAAEQGIQSIRPQK